MKEVSYGKTLKEAVLSLSESGDYVMSKKEWFLHRIEIAEGSDGYKRCSCGHYPIKELCYIRNKYNNSELLVGNECINKFLGIDKKEVFRNIKKVWEVPTLTVSENVIDYFYEKGVITSKNRDFYLSTRTKRSNATRKIMRYRAILNIKMARSIYKLSHGNFESIYGEPMGSITNLNDFTDGDTKYIDKDKIYSGDVISILGKPFVGKYTANRHDEFKLYDLCIESLKEKIETAFPGLIAVQVLNEDSAFIHYTSNYRSFTKSIDI